MRKAEKIILHAGLPKTATTSIQNALFSVKERLLKDFSICYPGDTPNHTNNLCTAFLEDPRKHISNIIAGNNDIKYLKKKADEIRRSYEEEIVKEEAKFVLFSAEGMANLTARELESFHQWALTIANSVEVIYIVRNPISYSTSVIQQHLKAGEILEELYRNPPLVNYRGRVGAGLRVFGRKAVLIHKFEDMVKSKDGVLGSFLRYIGIEKGKLYSDIINNQKKYNVSLSREAAHILSRLNIIRPAFVKGKMGPYRTMDEVNVIQRISGKKFVLPNAVKNKIRNLSIPDVNWLKNITDNTICYDLDKEYEDDDPHPNMSLKTIDSIAITISDLIIAARTAKLEAEVYYLYNSNRISEAKDLVRKIKEMNPEYKMPKYMIGTL